MNPRRLFLAVLLAAPATLAGCRALPAGLTAAPPTVTSVPPSPTPEPLAARVNGRPITLAEYQQEIARFEASQKSLGIDLATLGDYRARVLQALVDRELLADGARQNGFGVDAAAVDAKVNQMASTAGGSSAMGAWLAANGYTLDSLKASLAEEKLAQDMVQRIADGVPTSTEQVHARHILVSSQAEADALRAQVVGGADFVSLAEQQSLDLSTRLAGGDLGWFPKGVLTMPEVEAAAFALQSPGDLSPVVHSALGYHIVQLIERGVHPLTPQALQRLRELAVDDWLAAQRQQAKIEILAGP